MKNSNQRYRSSLFVQFAIIVIAVALFSLIMSMGVYRNNTENLLISEVESKATVFLSGLEGAVRRLIMGRPPMIPLTELVYVQSDFLAEYLNFNILRVAVLDPQGRILDHTRKEKIGSVHATNQDFNHALESGRPVAMREMKVLKLEEGSPEIPVIKIFYPIRHRNKTVIAVIVMDLDVRRTMRSIRDEYSRYNRRVFIGFGSATAVMVIAILFLLKRRILNPVVGVARASEDIARGRLNPLPVPKTRDEISSLMRAFNHMVEGLRQRDQMRLSLELAKEVQQNLLPQSAPQIPGLDVAGKSIYCDSTGGDYYDYLHADDPSDGHALLVVVGDVSDHGVQSALLMTTARAALHQCWPHAKSLAHILVELNGQLAADVEDSGYFMTMFLVRFDPQAQMVFWANAGHDCGLVYQTGSDTFGELAGHGLALGVDAQTEYVQWQQSLVAGQIFVIGTDGIWEARNRDGELYGKDRLKTVVRRFAALSARDMVSAIIGDVEGFISRPLEDDLTLAVIKIHSDNAESTKAPPAKLED